MKVVVDFCLIPLGAELSLSPYIAECQRVLLQCGLKHQLHAYGTNIEGEWEMVMDAIKRCHRRVHEMGAPRIHTTLKLGTRVDGEGGVGQGGLERQDELDHKVASVRALLRNDVP